MPMEAVHEVVATAVPVIDNSELSDLLVQLRKAEQSSLSLSGVLNGDASGLMHPNLVRLSDEVSSLVGQAAREAEAIHRLTQATTTAGFSELCLLATIPICARKTDHTHFL